MVTRDLNGLCTESSLCGIDVHVFQSSQSQSPHHPEQIRGTSAINCFKNSPLKITDHHGPPRTITDLFKQLLFTQPVGPALGFKPLPYKPSYRLHF